MRMFPDLTIDTLWIPLTYTDKNLFRTQLPSKLKTLKQVLMRGNVAHNHMTLHPFDNISLSGFITICVAVQIF